MNDTIKIDSKLTKMIAHRGLSGIECENTAAAFIAAGNRDYFGIETDVHVTSDGKYVVIHDDSTGRVSNVDIPVEQSTYSDLQSIVLKDRNGEERVDLRVPALADYLRICKCYGKTGVLELKNPIEEQHIEKIVDAVKQEYSTDNIIFISFDYHNLTVVRRLLPQANIQWLCDCKVDDELIQTLKKYDFDIDIAYKCLDEKAISLLHDNGVKINCWTVDDKNDAQWLINCGVDYITSNILQ